MSCPVCRLMFQISRSSNISEFFYCHLHSRKCYQKHIIMQGCVISCGTVCSFKNHVTFHDHCSLIKISTVQVSLNETEMVIAMINEITIIDLTDECVIFVWFWTNGNSASCPLFWQLSYSFLIRCNMILFSTPLVNDQYNIIVGLLNWNWNC